MYLRPEVRGQGLGRFLLHQLETAIATHGFAEIWVETASALKEAVMLYEKGQMIKDNRTAPNCLTSVARLPKPIPGLLSIPRSPRRYPPFVRPACN